MFTRSSVVCAERIVAHSSSKAPLWSSSHRSFAVPGYSAGGSSGPAVARPFGDRGLPIGASYRPAHGRAERGHAGRATAREPDGDGARGRSPRELVAAPLAE